MKCTQLLVLLNIFVLKSWAMTRSELAEFSDFIEKTSQLDLNFKSNPDVDGDDDEVVPENAWEESGKFEGDLILNERQRRLIVEDVAEGLSRNGLKDGTKRWPDNEVIYYIQREHFSEDQLQAIQSGIDDIAQASCVKFRPYTKGDRDAVVIQGSRRGCFSQVGYQGGYQVLNLYGRHPVGRGCFRHGTVVHELLHALGFYHMQSSPDRDDYIDIVWDNIIQPAKHNFRKYNTFAVSDFGVGYDYDSVLHYSKKAFSSNGKDTLVPKQTGVDIGQRIGLSEKDTQKLNKMYCDADSNNDDIGSRVPQRIPNKKKVLKNKPFEGHGIGYHQGKTVVIKLPAIETYRLPVLPMPHIFDHFSKTPQDVSEALTENYGSGKGIATSYDNAMPISDKIPEFDADKISEMSKEKSRNNVNIVEPTSFQEAENGKSNLDVGGAFKILNKVIKTHVYPPERSVNSEVINDYSEYYNPIENLQDSNEDLKIKLHDQTSSQLHTDKEIGVAHYENENPSYFISHRPNKTLKYDIKTKDAFKSKESNIASVQPIQNDRRQDVANEMDSTFRTSFPIERQTYFIQQTDPKAINIKDYQTDDYKHLYLPNENGGNVRQHKLFGENAPTNEDWNENDEFKRHIANYDKSSYTQENKDVPIKNLYKHLQNYLPKPEYENSHYSSPYTKLGHYLFGVSVPITKSWYKIQNEDDSPPEIRRIKDKYIQ